MGGDEDILLPVGLSDGDQLIPLVQPEGPDATGPNIFQRGGSQTLYCAVRVTINRYTSSSVKSRKWTMV